MSAEKPEAATDAGDLVTRLNKEADAWDGPHTHTGPSIAGMLREAAATIAALRADLAYYQAKWENELSTVSKLERERDALRREVDELRFSLHKVIKQRNRWDAACQQAKADADDAREEVNRITNNQRLQDSATAAILERAEAAERELSELKAWKADATDILGKGPDILIARSLLKELAACREDAERYRFIRYRTGADRDSRGRQYFNFPALEDSRVDLFKGAVACHLDDAIDAAIKAERGK